jgi:hypothetical protein
VAEEDRGFPNPLGGLAQNPEACLSDDAVSGVCERIDRAQLKEIRR